MIFRSNALPSGYSFQQNAYCWTSHILIAYMTCSCTTVCREKDFLSNYIPATIDAVHSMPCIGTYLQESLPPPIIFTFRLRWKPEPRFETDAVSNASPISYSTYDQTHRQDQHSYCTSQAPRLQLKVAMQHSPLSQCVVLRKVWRTWSPYADHFAGMYLWH